MPMIGGRRAPMPSPRLLYPPRPKRKPCSCTLEDARWNRTEHGQQSQHATHTSLNRANRQSRTRVSEPCLCVPDRLTLTDHKSPVPHPTDGDGSYYLHGMPAAPSRWPTPSSEHVLAAVMPRLFPSAFVTERREERQRIPRLVGMREQGNIVVGHILDHH